MSQMTQSAAFTSRPSWMHQRPCWTGTPVRLMAARPWLIHRQSLLWLSVETSGSSKNGRVRDWRARTGS